MPDRGDPPVDRRAGPSRHHDLHLWRALGEPCPTGTGAILPRGFARLACDAPIALPATRLVQVAIPWAAIPWAAIPCAVIPATGFAPLPMAGDMPSDEAVALSDTA